MSQNDLCEKCKALRDLHSKTAYMGISHDFVESANESICRCQRPDAPPLDHWSGCPVWIKFFAEQPKSSTVEGPDPLADLVVGTIICPGVPDHEHKIYLSELFEEYQGRTVGIKNLSDFKESWEWLKAYLKENQEGVGDGLTKALEKMDELESGNR